MYQDQKSELSEIYLRVEMPVPIRMTPRRYARDTLRQLPIPRPEPLPSQPPQEAAANDGEDGVEAQVSRSSCAAYACSPLF
jgi:hypothetical protein